MENENLIQKIIEEIWMNNINEDFTESYLLNEDTLKSSFYFHLRSIFANYKLFDQGIRIYTEYRLPNINKVVDMAIVKLTHISSEFQQLNCSKIIVLIEFKFKRAKISNLDYLVNNNNTLVFYTDLFKLLEYGSVFEDVLFYGAFIHDHFYNYAIDSWLRDVSNNFPKSILNRVTELVAYREEESRKLIIKVNKC